MSLTRIKQGLSAIANEVLEDVRKEAETVILRAEVEAKILLQAAKEEADKTYAVIIAQAESKALSEKRRFQSLTEVETRNLQLQLKEELVDVAFEKAKKKLREFAKTNAYRSCLFKFVEEGASKIGSDTLIIHVNSEDKLWLSGENLSSLSKRLHLDLRIAEDTENSVGGCRIESIDQKVIYDNTLENRLLQLRQILRLEVAKILFAKEDSKNAS